MFSLKKSIAFTLLLVMIYPLSSASALTLQQAVNNIQATDPALPTGVANPKGYIGSLLSELFYGTADGAKNGKIKSQYIDYSGISAWTQSGSHAFYSGTGNVGIGTPNPSAKEHIYIGSAGVLPTIAINPALILEHSGYDGQLQFLSPSNRASYIMFGDERDYARGGITYDHRSGSEGMFFSSSGTRRMTIMGDGNVGIGTPNPNFTLDVKSNTSANGGLVVAGNLSGISSFLMPLQNTGKMLVGWNWSSGGGENDLISNRGAGSNGGFGFYDYANNGTLTQLMTMQGNGNVGIGTTNPTNVLTLQKIGATVTAPAVDFRSTLPLGGVYDNLDYNGGRIYSQFDGGLYSLARLTLAYPTGVGTFADGLTLRNGNVGIGTTTPSDLLTLSGATATLINLNGATTNYRGLKMSNTSGTEQWFAGANPSNNYVIRGGGTDVMTFSGGNVGIGTASPGEKLEMAGNLSVGADIGLSSIHRRTVNGSNGVRLSGNASSTLNDANPGASILLGGGLLTDTYEGNVQITAYGSAIDDGNRNVIKFNNRSGVDTVTERMRISSNGNVGIGTASPGAPLHITSGNVTGGSQIFNALRIGPKSGAAHGSNGSSILFDSYTNYNGTNPISGIWSSLISGGDGGLNYAGALVFGTVSSGLSLPSERMRINDIGNIGIGTPNPNARLDLGSGYGANGEKFLIYNDDASSTLAGTKIGFYLDRFGSNNATFVFPEQSLNPGSFVIAAKPTDGTAINPYMTVKGLTGNVGIGTIDPNSNYKLDVAAAGRFGTGNIWYNGVYPAATGKVAIGGGMPQVAGNPGVEIFYYNNEGHIRAHNPNVAWNNLVLNQFGGNVGIGAANPGAKLTISGGEGTYNAPNFGTANLGAINITATASNTQNGITFSSAGNSNAQAGIYVHQDDALGTHMYFATTESYATGPKARVTILNNGNVGIGTVDPGVYKLYVNGTGYLGAAAWVYASDRRLKENITPLRYGIDEIMKLDTKKFDYIKGDKNNLGFIAQDVRKIFPELVTTQPSGMLGLKTDMIIPVLVNAVKELKTQKDSEIQELKKQNQDLKSLVCLDHLSAKICK